MDEIWEHIVSELQNPIATANVVNSIMDTVDWLEDFPKSGVPLSSIADADTEHRFLTSGNYLVFYRVYTHPTHSAL